MLLPVILLAFLGTTTASVQCGSSVNFGITICSSNADGKLPEKPRETPTPPQWFCESGALAPGDIVPIQITIFNDFKTNDLVPIAAQTVGGSSLLVYFACVGGEDCYRDDFNGLFVCFILSG